MREEGRVLRGLRGSEEIMMDRLDRVCRISRRAVQESLSGLIRSNFTVGDCNNTMVGRGIGVRLPFGVEGGHGVINGRRVTRLIDRRVGSKSDVVLSTDSATICITGALLRRKGGGLAILAGSIRVVVRLFKTRS